MTVLDERAARHDAEDRIRDAIIALAHQTARDDDTDNIPHGVLRALCPTVSDGVREACFASIVIWASHAGPDRSAPLPGDVEVDLDYMTGVRR